MDVDGETVDRERYDEKREISVFAAEDAADELIAGRARRDGEVFIGSISLEATEDAVRRALKASGAETGAVGFEMMTDRATGKHRGYAFARYGDPESAAKAIETIESARVEIGGQKIRASVKPNKTRVFVGGIRKDATRAECVEALRARGAGLEFFELARPKKKKEGVEQTDENGGHGWATYYNEACAERFMKNMREAEDKLPIANESDTRGMTTSWATVKASAVKVQGIRTLHVRDLNSTNATEEAMRECFGRFGDIEDVQLRTDREPHFAWVTFANPNDAEKALGECEPVPDAPEGRKGGSFISSVDGATLNIAPAKGGGPKQKGAPESGRGGPSRGGRDDWSKYRTGGIGGKYGGGLAPRGSWSGRTPANNTMPVILPTGQVAYAMMPNRGGGRGGRGGGRRDNRHRPY